MLRVVINDDENTSHGQSVKESISIGYGSDISNQIIFKTSGAESLLYVLNNINIISVVQPTSMVEFFIDTAKTFYPRVQYTFPLGSNDFARLDVFADTNPPLITTCGAGDFLDASQDRNNTAYGNGLEFWDHDLSIDDTGDASSFSTGIIAGKLLKIKDYLKCSWWEARYRARMTADKIEPNRATTPLDIYNGYGKINVASAINYVGIIQSDPYLYTYTPTKYFKTMLVKQ